MPLKINKKPLLLFLVGTFSMVQIKIVGYIGISELVMLLFGPILLIIKWKVLKRDGLLILILLAAAWTCSAVYTDIYRGTEIIDMLRGVASPLIILVMIPCFHWLLEDEPKYSRWALVGFTVSVFISTYLIPTGSIIGAAQQKGISAGEMALEYKLSYLTMLVSVASLIPLLWYHRIPRISVIIVLVLAGFSLHQGSRSGFLVLWISSVILLIARKNINQWSKIMHRMPILLVSLFGLTYLALFGYEFAVKKGYMGEYELKKFETESETKIGVLSGRSNFISTYFAVKDSPIIGHGSWAKDYSGYGLKTAYLIDDYSKINYYRNRRDPGWIPGHSHIFTAYIWHGILGALFWIYVLIILWGTFRYYMGNIPELFAYFAIALPNLFWAILFSPFGGRVTVVMVIVLSVLVRHQEYSPNQDIY